MRIILGTLVLALLTGCASFRLTPEEAQAESDLNRELTARAQMKVDAFNTAVETCQLDLGPVPPYSCEPGDSDCARAYSDLLRTYEEVAEETAACVAEVSAEGADANTAAVVSRASAGEKMFDRGAEVLQAYASPLSFIFGMREVRKTSESNNAILGAAVQGAGDTITNSYNTTDHSGDQTDVSQGDGAVYGSGSVTNNDVSGSGRFESDGDNIGTCQGTGCSQSDSQNPVTTPAPVVVQPIVSQPVVVNGRFCTLVAPDPSNPTVLELVCDP